MLFPSLFILIKYTALFYFQSAELCTEHITHINKYEWQMSKRTCIRRAHTLLLRPGWLAACLHVVSMCAFWTLFHALCCCRVNECRYSSVQFGLCAKCNCPYKNALKIQSIMQWHTINPFVSIILWLLLLFPFHSFDWFRYWWFICMVDHLFRAHYYALSHKWR